MRFSSMASRAERQAGNVTCGVGCVVTGAFEFIAFKWKCRPMCVGNYYASACTIGAAWCHSNKGIANLKVM